MKQSRSALGVVTRWLGRGLLILWCAFSAFTIIWILMSALKTTKEFFGNAWSLFSTPQWGNYETALTQYKLARYFVNSLKVVLGADLIVLLIATPAAYVVSRVPFKWVQRVGMAIVFCMGVPLQLILVPLYFELNAFGLRNTHLGLMLVYVTIQIPISMFLINSFFKGLPRALEEAALVDGASPIRTFYSVMLPLGRPGIITALILNFITLWNEFLFAFTFIDKSKMYTLSVGLYTLNSSMQYTGEWTVLMAGFAVTLIPTLAVYLLLSKQIIAGLTLGAVKG